MVEPHGGAEKAKHGSLGASKIAPGMCPETHTEMLQGFCVKPCNICIVAYHAGL